MELNEYQEKAMRTCLPSSDNLLYMLTNLVGEVGEFSGKIAKHVRKGNLFVTTEERNSNGDILHTHMLNISQEEKDDLKKEAGDIAWQLAGLCNAMGWSLEEVCQMNLDKLASRQSRGVIDGSGDRR